MNITTNSYRPNSPSSRPSSAFGPSQGRGVGKDPLLTSLPHPEAIGQDSFEGTFVSIPTPTPSTASFTGKSSKKRLDLSEIRSEPVDISDWKAKLNPTVLGHMEYRDWKLGENESFTVLLDGQLSDADISRLKEEHGFQLHGSGIPGDTIHTAQGMNLQGLQTLAQFETVSEIEASISTLSARQSSGRVSPPM